MDDNARKFIVDQIDSNFLKVNDATSAFLVVDWLITEEDKEKKLVYKKFNTGDIQLWLVEKVITEGNRTTKKTKLSEVEYKDLLRPSTMHLEKTRYEFNFINDGTTFSIKYDEFLDGKLCMLEVDALSEAERNDFEMKYFPYTLTEVTGDVRYYGYRMTDMLK